MALVDIGTLHYPSLRQVSDLLTLSEGPSTQINATYLRYALVFQVPATGTIDKITYTMGAVTTSQQIRIGIYTVDSSGNPTTTPYGSSAYVTRASVSANTSYTETLSSTASATKGDLAAIVIEWDSTTGDVKFQGCTGVLATTKLPVGMRYNGAAWSYPVYQPCFAPGYSTTYYDIGVSCFSAANNAFIWNSGTAGSDEYALVWPCTFDCRVTGIWAYCNISAAGADFEAILYEGTTARATIAVDGDVGSTGYALHNFLFASPYTVAAGTTYYLALRPTTANSIRLYYGDVTAAGVLATLGGKSDMCSTSRLDLGSWASSTTTRRPMLGAIIDQLDDGAGGGSGGGPLIGTGRLVRN